MVAGVVIVIGVLVVAVGGKDECTTPASSATPAAKSKQGQTREPAGDGSQFENDVQPGRTARDEYPTTLKSVQGIKLNVTGFDRAASY